MPRVRGRGDLEALSWREHEAYGRALEAVSIARTEGVPAREAARRAHTTIDNIRRWAPDVLRKDAAGRLVFESADRLYRPIRVIARGGEVVEVDTRGSRVTSLASAYARTVDLFRAGLVGPEAFRPFEGESIGGVELEADPDRIDELEASGALEDFESFYAGVA